MTHSRLSDAGTFRPRLRSWFNLGILLSASVVLVCARLHAFSIPLERDEGNYAYIGWRLLAGDRLYVDVWDHQPFGVFLLFAGASVFFGSAPEVYRWMAVGFSIVSLLIIAFILRRTFGWHAALLGSALFALVSADPGTAGEGCNREIYMNSLILLGWALALPQNRQNGWNESGESISAYPAANRPSWVILLAGCVLAIGTALKTVVAVHWFVLAFWCLLSARWIEREHGASEKKTGWWRVTSLRTCLLLSAGPFLLWGGAFAYFAATDRFKVFFDAVFGFNLGYADQPEGLLARWTEFFAPSRAPRVFASARELWLVALGATGWLLYRVVRMGDRRAIPLLLLLVSGYVAVCLPGQFWPHYYYLMVPPVVIVVAAAMAQLSDDLTRRVRSLGLSAAGYSAVGLIPWVIAIVLLSVVFMGQYDHYLGVPDWRITEHRYRGVDFWARAMGERVGEATNPEDDVWVYGNDASIYYYAHRRCATRYSMITALNRRFPGHARHRRILIEELKLRRPRLVLVRLGEESFPEWEQFLTEGYDPIGWDLRDTPPHDAVLMVLADRTRPIAALDWEWRRP